LPPLGAVGIPKEITSASGVGRLSNHFDIVL
jgi:hypothetical protein